MSALAGVADNPLLEGLDAGRIAPVPERKNVKKIALLLILALGALLAVEFDDIRRYLKMAKM